MEHFKGRNTLKAGAFNLKLPKKGAYRTAHTYLIGICSAFTKSAGVSWY
jgi:hypothetical protein